MTTVETFKTKRVFNSNWSFSIAILPFAVVFVILSTLGDDCWYVLFIFRFLARKELLKVREDEIMRLMYIGRFNRNAELFLENYTAYT